jgi:hypothetical protein
MVLMKTHAHFLVAVSFLFSASLAQADTRVAPVVCELNDGGELRFLSDLQGGNMTVELHTKPRGIFSKKRRLQKAWQVDTRQSKVKTIDELLAGFRKGQVHIMTNSGALEIERPRHEEISLWFHDESHDIAICRDSAGRPIEFVEVFPDAHEYLDEGPKDSKSGHSK